MVESKERLPIEERFVEMDNKGKVILIPALSRTWVELSDKNFSKYLCHPDPEQSDFMEERAIWLELTNFVVEDFEWLLRQRHHIFWSHMVYSVEAQWLIFSFLQYAPPYYLRNEFPKDEEMESILAKAEHLAFLVLVRLSTQQESSRHFIRNLGDLLYNNFLFTIPMFLDIFSIFGYKNKDLVARLFEDVVTISPRYLQDLEIIPPFFLKVLQSIKDKFDVGKEAVRVSELSKMSTDSIRSSFLHLFDSAASMQIFFDINSKYASYLRTELFLSEVAFFYSQVIPKMHNYIKKNEDKLFESFIEKIEFLRLNLLSIVKSVFCYTINDVLHDEKNREDHANEYLTRLMDIVQEQLFMADYNKVYPLEHDLRLLSDLCANLDAINLKYVYDAVASCSVAKYKADDLKDYRLASLIAEVKDVLPELGEGFIEFCLKFYDFNTSKVIAVLCEDALPPCLDELDRGMERQNGNQQKIIRARINAEKQWRMDKACSNATVAQRANTRPESEENAEGAGINAGAVGRTDEAGTSAGTARGNAVETKDKTGKMMDVAGASGGFEEDIDDPWLSVGRRRTGRGGKNMHLNLEMINIFNDKSDLQKIRDRILNLSLQSSGYEDEYDDTYDEKSLFVKESRNVDEEKRYAATATTSGAGSTEAEEKSSEDEGQGGPYYRPENDPASIKARLLKRRMDKLRRDFIDRKKAQMQDSEVTFKRNPRDGQKNGKGNQNRKQGGVKKKNSRKVDP